MSASIWIVGTTLRARQDPTETELKVIDTYWSDHCRHTTFLAEPEIEIDGGEEIKKVTSSTGSCLGNKWGQPQKILLPDGIATIGAKPALSGA